jgi:IclR family transcriptional regulator, KDG regulon repressor
MDIFHDTETISTIRKQQSMENGQVQSITRAFQILNLLRDHRNGLGVKNISIALNLTVSTVHRLLKTLIECKAVAQDPVNRSYYLAPQMLLYGKAVLDRFDFIREAHPILGELSKEIQETVFMGIIDDGQLVYVDHVDSLDHILRMPPQIGRRQAAYSTALGKAILAYLPTDRQQQYIHMTEFQPFTPNTICDPDRLIFELQKIKATGFAIDNQESETGICCVAAPIFNLNGEVVAAISTSGPLPRMEMKGLDSALKERVVATAKKISSLVIV